MGIINGLTGEHLRIARIVYGYESQEKLAEEAGVSLGTIQRYEASETVDAKVAGVYEHQLGFDLEGVYRFIERVRRERRLVGFNSPVSV